MSEYESLSIVVSLISAFIALQLIMVSRNTANEQKQIAHRTQDHEFRNSAATHLGKYSDLLRSVRGQTKPQSEALSLAAKNSFQKICNLFDEYDLVPHMDANNHYVCVGDTYELACKMIYEAYGLHHANPLIWPTGMDLERSEYSVINSDQFVLIRQKIIERVLPENQILLFQKTLDALIPYFCAHDNARKVLSSEKKRLEEGLVKNKIEEFSIEESPSLSSDYKKELAKLGILEEFGLPLCRNLQGRPMADPIPRLLHIGGVLYSLELYENWGRFNKS